MKPDHMDVAAVLATYRARLNRVSGAADRRQSCCVCGGRLTAGAPVAIRMSRVCGGCRARSELKSCLSDQQDQEWAASYPESGLFD